VSPDFTCPSYLKHGDARRAASHEHWIGRAAGKQVTIINLAGEKVAIIPVKAGAATGPTPPGEPPSYTYEPGDMDVAVRRMALIVAAPALEALLWAALDERPGWREQAAETLRYTGFLPQATS
jgi:hypothetical protein